jgi:glutamate-ammonia-ligase adenylyltransferase
VDADLRPEGRNGPLVRSLASYAAYYARWSAPWEAQALLRAEPAAGDPELGARFVAMIDPLRYPADGVDTAALLHMRRLKARMEAERLPRGVDPHLHTKLGRGGLSDVEWTVQLLQLQHGAAHPDLRTTRTLEALSAAVRHDLIGECDAELLGEAWRMATQVRNAVMLVRGRASDSVPTDLQDLAGVARVLGRSAEEPPSVVREDYLRITRRARRVVDQVFYGHSDVVYD